MPAPQPQRREVRGGRRQGIVLVLVVGFAAIATITGLSVLQANATALPAARNLLAAAQARQIAASGVALASHYLRVPPSATSPGSYWSGASGVSMDGSSNTCDVTVTRSATSAQTFTVTSRGVVRNPDGSIAAVDNIATEIMTPAPVTQSISRAFTSSTTPTLSNDVSFYGDLHANGALSSAAYCSGTVSATGTVTWTNATPPAAIISAAPAVALPALNTSAWSRYVVYGVVRASQTYADSSLKATSIAAVAGGRALLSAYYQPDGSIWLVDTSSVLPTGYGWLGPRINVVGSAVGVTGTLRSLPSAVSLTNPGGVLEINGDLDVTAGQIGYLGTLVVKGNLSIKAGSTPQFCAMPGYPALVVTGDISIDDNNTVEIRGLLQYSGSFQKKKPSLTVYGPTLSYGPGFATDFASSSRTANFRWTAGYESIYDFSIAAVMPMTLLKWSE